MSADPPTTSAAAAQGDWTVRRVLEWTASHLRQHGSECPRLEAEILLAHARGCDRIHLYTRYGENLSDAERSVMRELVQRRAKSEPVAHLVGRREFFSLDFKVSPAVLIPRPDTETLVVEALERLKQSPTARVLDIGTGSGCIAISIAVHARNCKVTAVDVSPLALEIARDNAETHGVLDRIAFVEGDCLKTLPDHAEFEMIVSNPPYIRTVEIAGLSPDVQRHEPHLALDGGQDGLDLTRRIIAEAPSRLVPGGSLLLEIGCDQRADVLELIAGQTLLEEARCYRDLAGLDRVVAARRRT